LEGILDAPFYHLVKAHSGDEAFKYLLSEGFSDVQMPGLFAPIPVSSAPQRTDRGNRSQVEVM